MIYIIILLILAILTEFLLLRKGLKAAQKNSAYLRKEPVSSMPKNSRSNKRVQQPIESDQADVGELQQEPAPVIPEIYENVGELPNGGQHGAFSEQEREMYDDVPGTMTQEKSMLDIIQEIRGEKSQPEQGSEYSPEVQSQFKTSVEDEEEYEEVDEYEEVAEIETDHESPRGDVTSEDGGLEGGEESKESDIQEIFEAPDEIEEAEEVPSPEELLKSGINFVRQGKLHEGIAILEQAVETSPEKAETHFNLGIAYTLQAATAQAIEAYQRAIGLEPRYGKAFFNLGTLYLKQGNVEEAISKLERAVRFLPEPMKALWNLYEAYRSRELFPKALVTLQKLIELEPDDASLHNHLGICYVKLGKYTQAITSWNRSISLGASSRLIFYNLGKTYELCENFSAAVEQYEQFLRQNSENADWQELVSEVQDRLENLRQ